MQAIWPVSQSYLLKHSREEIHYPDFDHCTQCDESINLHRHGYYQRNVPWREKVRELDICRYLCPHCGKTLSLLPWFLMPHFQYPRNTILETLREHFLGGVAGYISRQLASFYAIGMTPLNKYMSQTARLKMVDDPSKLRYLFMRREQRRVNYCWLSLLIKYFS